MTTATAFDPDDPRWANLSTERPASVQANGITGKRTVQLTSASTIKPRPTHWLWEGRLPLGSLALIGGREGIGKSTLAYTLAADITRGRMPGVHHGHPKAVIVAATEDAWAETIVPRLMAAGADLGRVFRIDVTTSTGVEAEVILPLDLRDLEQVIGDADAAMVLLDPLLSRLDPHLDSHKDADVRRALEPLKAMAERTRCLMLGLIHVNKSTGSDPLSLFMGSRAFVAVARAALFVMKDPEDEDLRLVGQPKNNLGRTDLPTLTYRIRAAMVAETDEGQVWTGQLIWGAEDPRSVTEALEDTQGGGEYHTAAGEAMGWLEDYLTANGGTALRKDILTAAKKEAHTEAALKRAGKKLKVTMRSEGFPRQSWWSLPGTQPDDVPVSSPPGESELTELNELTARTGHPVGPVSPVGSISSAPRHSEPTEDQ